MAENILPRDLIRALYENVTFPPGIASKRFIRDMASRSADAPISEKAARYAWRIAYIYRRQLPKAVADEAIARKQDHKLLPPHNRYSKGYCLTCQRDLSGRELNAPCPGPPEPKPEPKPRRRVVIEQRVVDGAVEFECQIEAPQRPLFAEATEVER